MNLLAIYWYVLFETIFTHKCEMQFFFSQGPEGTLKFTVLEMYAGCCQLSIQCEKLSIPESGNAQFGVWQILHRPWLYAVHYCMLVLESQLVCSTNAQAEEAFYIFHIYAFQSHLAACCFGLWVCLMFALHAWVQFYL